MGSHPVNLAFRFLLEVAALAVFGIWGWQLSAGWIRFVLALALPVLAAALWGIFNVPNDPSRSGAAPVPVPGFIRLILELAIFALAIWMLNDLKYSQTSTLLSVAVAVHYVISYDRLRWLLLLPASDFPSLLKTYIFKPYTSLHMLQKKIQALFHPERYHGWGKNKKYFEGWYYKIISADEKHAFAFIPGIAMDNNGNKQAFIQILDGKKQTAEYIKFPATDFISQSNTFKTEIAGNTFELNKIQLQLQSAKGELHFNKPVLWPNNWYSPGIMGPYAFVPFMECYHGILSMDHEIAGELVINNQKIDFTGGRGYLEKDWGHSFPSAYIWMQSNHFSKKGISFKASVAKIPWLGSSFVGFIAGLYFNQKLIQFTTYNSTKLTRSIANKKTVELVMENKNYRLEILAQRNSTTELAAPISGFMDGRISESMTAKLEIKLIDTKSKETIFYDTARNTALEVAGAINEITIGKN